jgi:hypothetical protein
MRKQESITPTPRRTATNAGELHRAEVLQLIELAHEQASIAAYIADSFDSLDDLRFSDLDLIARNCHAATKKLERVRTSLAESEVAA